MSKINNSVFVNAEQRTGFQIWRKKSELINNFKKKDAGKLIKKEKWKWPEDTGRVVSLREKQGWSLWWLGICVDRP